MSGPKPDTIVDELLRVSVEMASAEALETQIREHASMLRSVADGDDAARSRSALELLRTAVRVLGQATAASGKAYLLAKATVLAAADACDGSCSSSGEQAAALDAALARALSVTAQFDPELPGRVASKPSAIDRLRAAAQVLVVHSTNQQQLWLPEMHEALRALGIVDGDEDATRMAIARGLHDAVDSPVSDRSRLLHRLCE